MCLHHQGVYAVRNYENICTLPKPFPKLISSIWRYVSADIIEIIPISPSWVDSYVLGFDDLRFQLIDCQMIFSHTDVPFSWFNNTTKNQIMQHIIEYRAC